MTRGSDFRGAIVDTLRGGFGWNGTIGVEGRGFLTQSSQRARRGRGEKAGSDRITLGPGQGGTSPPKARTGGRRYGLANTGEDSTGSIILLSVLQGIVKNEGWTAIGRGKRWGRAGEIERKSRRAGQAPPLQDVISSGFLRIVSGTPL